MTLSKEQVTQLLAPLSPSRVQRDDKNMSHLAAWDVRRYLIRIFGPTGWENEIISLDFVYEKPTKTQKGRDAWIVGYRATTRLCVKDENGKILSRWEDGAFGSATLPSLGDAHDMAMKTALSQSLKRCAVNLGDQFGLSLYNSGSVVAVVGRTLASPVEASAVVTEEVEGDTERQILKEDKPEHGSDHLELLNEISGAVTFDQLEKIGGRIARLKTSLTNQQISALQMAWKDRNTALRMEAIEIEIAKAQTQDDYDRVVEMVNKSFGSHADTCDELISLLDDHFSEIMKQPA